MSAQPGSETITLELPARLLADYPGTRQEFVQNLRLAAAIEWFREGKISQVTIREPAEHLLQEGACSKQ